jgi:hypothetical protein
MAYTRNLPTLEQWAAELAARAKPGGDTVKGLDGLSGDSNTRGASSPTGGEGEKEQGQGANNRGDGGRRTTEERRASSQGDNGLPVSPTSLPPSTIPAGTLFATADNILKKIADRFNLAREEGKVQAWRQLQRDLMDASPFIVPIFIPYKDLIQIVADIEKEIKGSTSQAGKSNEELLADFLAGGVCLPPTIPVPASPIDYDIGESLDTAVIVGVVGEGEDSIPASIPPPQP